MKNLSIVIFYALMLFFMSCEKDDSSSENATSAALTDAGSGVFTLSSKDNKGFSAEKIRLADFPQTSADFIIIPQTSMTGDVMSPFLSNPNLERRFILSDEFEDSKSAEAFFNTYEWVPDGEPLDQFALNLKANQVWLVKTRSGEFCKMLILETKVDKSTSFVEIKFKAERLPG